MTRRRHAALLCAALMAGVAASADACAADRWRSHRRGFVYDPLLYRRLPPVVTTTVPRMEPHLFGPYALPEPPPGGPYPPSAPLPLPEGMQLEIDPPSGATGAPARLDRWRDVGLALRACWAPPARTGHEEPRAVTLRLGFSRFGRVLGAPRVTYTRPAATTQAQKAFTAAALAALARCSPLPFTPGLGSAIAGIPFSIRFTDARPASTTR